MTARRKIFLEIQFYREEKWFNRQKATKLGVFRMGTIIIKKFASTNNELTANYAKKKEESGKKTGKICKEDQYHGTHGNFVTRTQTPRTRKEETK